MGLDGPQPRIDAMCTMMSKYKSPAVAVASTANAEAAAQADLEARLRRRRAGAAADVLTSPVGIPSTRTLGGVAA